MSVRCVKGDPTPDHRQECPCRPDECLAGFVPDPQPPAPEPRFDGFLRWAESTGAGGTWEIERDVARALAARLRQAERKAEYAWKFVGRCEVAEGKVREAEARVRELEAALRELVGWQPHTDKVLATLHPQHREAIEKARALLGFGEGQERQT